MKKTALPISYFWISYLYQVYSTCNWMISWATRSNKKGEKRKKRNETKQKERKSNRSVYIIFFTGNTAGTLRKGTFGAIVLHIYIYSPLGIQRWGSRIAQRNSCQFFNFVVHRIMEFFQSNHPTSYCRQEVQLFTLIPNAFVQFAANCCSFGFFIFFVFFLLLFLLFLSSHDETDRKPVGRIAPDECVWKPISVKSLDEISSSVFSQWQHNTY